MNDFKGPDPDAIVSAHGNGGKLTHALISDIFKKAFNNKILDEGLDSAIIDIAAALKFLPEAASPDFDPSMAKIAMTTDSYVVNPLFFSGGDIGKLAICGTLNDLAVCGARSFAITAAFIIEEGFKISELKKIVDSMANEAFINGVPIVGGDTKVVGRGQCDGIYINTSGYGVAPVKPNFKLENIIAGDEIIITGYPGNHGICILNERGGYVDRASIKSDCASLAAPLLNIAKEYPCIRVMRDLTRGGLATALNEFVSKNQKIGIMLDENLIRYEKSAKALADILGIDLLYSACEGCAVIVCPQGYSKKIIESLASCSETSDSVMIGCAGEKNPGRVVIKTSIGGARFLDMQLLEQFPRIC